MPPRELERQPRTQRAADHVDSLQVVLLDEGAERIGQRLDRRGARNRPRLAEARP
jgi:hypothetical protein